MTAPNTQFTSLQQQIGSSQDGVSLMPPAFQRSQPTQGPIPTSNTGLIIVFSANNGGTSNANLNTVTVVGLTTANSIKANLGTTDMVLAVTKPTAQAGMGIAGIAANAADTIQVSFVNPTAANVALTANETYYCAVARGLNTIAVPAGSGLAANLAANATVEQIINLAGSNASATAAINGAGQVVSANVTAQGSNYLVPPAVVFTPANGSSGTGATALATVTGGGVTSIVITNGGSGYSAAPTVSFVGGTAIAPGMFAQINQSTANIANLAIGNVRVAGPNQIAVQFVNTGIANVAANANMTFNVIALPSLPTVCPVVQCSANMATLVATGTFLSNISTNPVNNITANDVVIGVATLLSNSNYAMGPSLCTANNINLSFYGNAVTPGAGCYTTTVHRNPGYPPMQVYSIYLAPSAVANNTTAEQVFTLPANITLFANSAVAVNKPSFTPGISIVNARANSTTTLGVTFMNTSTGTITPPAEFYTLASFTMPTMVLANAANSNATTGAVAQVTSLTINQLVNLPNELQQSLQTLGAIKGS